MPVHPEIQNILNIIPKHDPNHRIVPEEHRKVFDVPSLPVEERVQVQHVEDVTISTPEATLTLRIYTPDEQEAYPVLMYFHGGAFLSGTLDSHDDVARALCKASGQKVVSVGYRLAPEHPYPAALVDCYAATKWVTENSETLKWDGENLALAGDSSGGNLVAAVTLKARAENELAISKQVLLYPSLDLDFSTFRYPSLTENGTGYFVESAQLAEMNGFYLMGGVDTDDPLVSPLREDNLADLPAALVITAEYDPFRDEGELYAEKLQKAGVSVTVKRYDGVTHGFLGKWTHLPEYSGVYAFISEFLNAKVASTQK
ncbi:MAG: alpha/beta hydrolase [Solibacillus sp.]